MIRRREFIAGIGGAAVAATPLCPLAARAQQPAMPVLGVLYGVRAADWTDQMAGFHRGLGEMGFVEGRSVSIEYRWAEGRFDRLPAMAADLVARKVAVILAGGNSVQAAMAANQTIPIVFTTGIDPVARGLVASLARPGGNATGVTFIGSELEPKRIELLHEVLPAARKIALLVNASDRGTAQGAIRSAQAAAQRLGLEIIIVDGGDGRGIEDAFENAIQQRAAALYVTTSAILQDRREQIAALGLRHKLPTSSNSRAAAVSGMLLSYGANIADTYRQAGVLVGRVLKGEKPSDLPVMRPAKFELVVNLKTAKAIGLTIPESFLLRADEVIE